MTDNKLKIVFAGTPDFAAGNLQYLIDNGYDVCAVYSQPDRKKGRGKKLQPSPVKNVAVAHDIPVYQPLNFKDEADIQQLRDLNADLMVVVAYGLLLPESVLSTPKHGCINVHASLLPRWRGAAPIERSIEAGDSETGITIMQMDKGLDTGDMLTIAHVAIDDKMTGDNLRTALLMPGCQALGETLEALQRKALKPQKQDDEQANYAHKLNKLETLIDWSQSAQAIDRKIRAFNSSNVCATTIADQVVKIWSATVIDMASKNSINPGKIIDIGKKHMDVACGQGTLRLQELQLPNSKRMDVAAVLNGKRELFPVGAILGATDNTVSKHE